MAIEQYSDPEFEVDPGEIVAGPARADRRTKELVKRLRPGDIAVIDHADIDRVAAEDLIRCAPSAVVNASTSFTGRYPNVGPLLIAEAGIPLIDDVGSEVLDLSTKVRSCASSAASCGGATSSSPPAGARTPTTSPAGRSWPGPTWAPSSKPSPSTPWSGSAGRPSSPSSRSSCPPLQLRLPRPPRPGRGPGPRLPQRPQGAAGLHPGVPARPRGRRRRRRRAPRGRPEARHHHRRLRLGVGAGAGLRGRPRPPRPPRRAGAGPGAAPRLRRLLRRVRGRGHQRGRRHAPRRRGRRRADRGRRHPRQHGRVPRQGPGRHGVDLPHPAAARPAARRRQGREPALRIPPAPPRPGHAHRRRLPRHARGHHRLRAPPRLPGRACGW